MRILCVYATRQLDSNLMMSSTIFNGLFQNNYHVDMVFAGDENTISIFSNKYSKYFHKVYYTKFKKSPIKRLIRSLPKGDLLYSYFVHFVYDQLFKGYDRSIYKKIKNDSVDYDLILSFIPPIISGKLAIDINKRCFNGEKRIIQFWTDPLSLGRCNTVSDIPWYRFFHRFAEKSLLRSAYKAVFCYPLLCEMEKKLYPQFKAKLLWSDVSYLDRDVKQQSEQPIKIQDKSSITKEYTIGLFGTFHSSIRNIHPLLNAAKSFPNTKFIIRGDSDFTEFDGIAPNVDISVGRLPASDVELLENSCDALIILGNVGGIQIPGKVYYYSNYPMPLICICDSVHSGALKEYLAPLNRYILCDNNLESIKIGIEKALDELAHKTTWEVPERLEPKVIARKLVEL